MTLTATPLISTYTGSRESTGRVGQGTHGGSVQLKATTLLLGNATSNAACARFTSSALARLQVSRRERRLPRTSPHIGRLEIEDADLLVSEGRTPAARQEPHRRPHTC
jgi:hypothetical protein